MFKFINNRQSNNVDYKAFSQVEAKVEKKSGLAKDHIEFVTVKGEDSTIELAHKIGKGIPLCINFEETEVKSANKMLFFLSGVLFPLGGEVIEIQDRVYLFASYENLKDNSLREFVANFR